MKKAILYARFSPRRNADQCESCQLQLEACRRYCEFANIEILDSYSDEGLSGSKADNRPGLQAALKNACKHKAALVVHSLSRFARSTKDAIINAEILQNAGADLISLKEQIDTTTPTGRFVFTVFAALDELERERIAERTKAAMLRHQANGKRMSKQPPYGFAIDPDNPAGLIENITEQQIIDLIITMKDSGLSFRAICRQLQSDGIKCRDNPNWHHTTVKRIINRYDINL